MNNKRGIITFIFVINILSLPTFSQNYNDPNNIQGNQPTPIGVPQGQNTPPDTSTVEDTVKVIKERFNWKNNPKVASLASTILPGAGQIYNEQLWKVPIVWGVLGTMGFLVLNNNARYQDFRSAFIYLQQKNPDNYNETLTQVESRERYNEIYIRHPGQMLPYGVDTTQSASELAFYRDDARRTRDWSALFFILGYVCNIIDASVDAHFKHFDVSDKLSLKMEPLLLTQRGQLQVGLHLTLSFMDGKRKNIKY